MPAMPLTPEQLADAKRLSVLYEAWKDRRRFAGEPYSQLFAAGELGFGQSALSQYKNGIIPLNIDALIKFCRLLGCHPSDISPDLAAKAQEHALATAADEASPFAMVEHADVKFSAGHGRLVFVEGSKSSLAFRKDFLRSQGTSERSAVLVQVTGSSMEPTIPDGAVLLINRSAQSVVNGRIYAFRVDGELLVKRLFSGDDGIRATSDNQDREAFPDLLINRADQEFEMIGRALWMGAKL